MSDDDAAITEDFLNRFADAGWNLFAFAMMSCCASSITLGAVRVFFVLCRRDELHQSKDQRRTSSIFACTGCTVLFLILILIYALEFCQRDA